jgi:hypothetical protein
MKKISLFCLVTIAFFLTINLPVFASGKPPEEGRTLPSIKLPVPESAGEKATWALKEKALSQFLRLRQMLHYRNLSMYCLYCHNKAPRVNNSSALKRIQN